MQSVVPVRACSAVQPHAAVTLPSCCAPLSGWFCPGLSTGIACAPETTPALPLSSCYSVCCSAITADALQC